MDIHRFHGRPWISMESIYGYPCLEDSMDSMGSMASTASSDSMESTDSMNVLDSMDYHGFHDALVICFDIHEVSCEVILGLPCLAAAMFVAWPIWSGLRGHLSGRMVLGSIQNTENRIINRFNPPTIKLRIDAMVNAYPLRHPIPTVSQRKRNNNHICSRNSIFGAFRISIFNRVRTCYFCEDAHLRLCRMW